MAADWLAADPTRLGLGQVVVLAQELTHAHGGSLDILAADGDTYYSIEVQLGEVDASHGFRVLDYWAHNRARYPEKTHVAALLVESADGRFRQALQAIAEYLPLIVVALRAWRGAGEVVLVPEPLIVNESLDVGGTVGLASGKVRTEQAAPAMAVPKSLKLASPTPPSAPLAAAPMLTASDTTGRVKITAIRTSVVRRATVLAAGQMRIA
jgi:hypothetical protein